MKKYHLIKLKIKGDNEYDKIQTDEEWEMYVYQTDEIYKKEFKDTKCEKYFLDMLLATTDRLEKIWKERNSKS